MIYLMDAEDMLLSQEMALGSETSWFIFQPRSGSLPFQASS